MLHRLISHHHLRLPRRISSYHPHIILIRYGGSSPDHPAREENGHLGKTYVVTPPRVWVPEGTSVVDGTTAEVVSVTVMVVAGNV